MEGIPFSNENEDEDKESSESKSTSKSAENIGAFLVEPKTEKPKPTLFESLFKQEADVEKAEDDGEQTATVPEQSASVEVGEQPLDQLSPAESMAVEQQIVRSRQAESDPSEDDPDTQAAIGQFRSKITDEGKSSDQALGETLDAIDAIDSSPEADVQPPSTFSVTEQMPETIIDIPAQAAQETEDQAATNTPQPSFAPWTSSSTSIYERTAPAPQPEVVVVEKDDASGLLVGGIVGYLVGRRRGRIRTEKRLLPIQAKLEKQVKSMEDNIIAKEAAIRAAVKQNQEQAAAMVELQKTTQRLRGTAEQNRTSESRPLVPEAALQQPEKQRQILFAETLSGPQLLAIAESILVDGVPLSRTFEANRITEDGLRRVVGEYLRGGDVPRALRLELIDGEQAFERDPVLRDNAAMLPQPHAHSASTHQPTQQKNVESARLEHHKATLAARKEHDHIASKARKQRQRVMDIVLATLIFILVCAIVGLVIARR